MPNEPQKLTRLSDAFFEPSRELYEAEERMTDEEFYNFYQKYCYEHDSGNFIYYECPYYEAGSSLWDAHPHVCMIIGRAIRTCSETCGWKREPKEYTPYVYNVLGFQSDRLEKYMAALHREEGKT